MQQPHYYLMKHKKILRLEENESFGALSLEIRSRVIDENDIVKLDQSQANWRVVIFRDEILDLEEYKEWLSSPEAFEEEVFEYELAAN